MKLKRDERIMITPTRVSYAVLAATIILARLLHLGAPLLVILFSYFALRQLYYVTRRKWLALALFIIGVAGIGGCRSLFYTDRRFGSAGCGGYLHTIGQRLGSEEQDRVTFYGFRKSQAVRRQRARGGSELPA